MTCRQNTTTVFYRNAYHFAPEIGSYSQFIANCGHEHVARRLSSICTFNCTNSSYCTVFCTIHVTPLQSVVPAIACDTVYGGHTTRINAGMAASGDSGRIRNECVLAAKAFIQHPAEA